MAQAFRGTPKLIELATQAVCLSILGGALLVVTGLWPETTLSVVVCGIAGWTCFALAYLRIRRMQIR